MHLKTRWTLWVFCCCLLAVFQGCNKDDAPEHPLIDGSVVGSQAHFPADYKDEYTIQIISGDNQFAVPGVQLAEPLKIRIVNVEGKPVEGIEVWFGWNNMPGPDDVTNADGYAQSYYTPHHYTDEQFFGYGIELRTNIDYNSIHVISNPASFTYRFNASIVAGGNEAGERSDQFLAPKGIFADAAGNLYIADSENHRVQKWAPGATSGQTVAGGNGAGQASNQLNNPQDVWVDGAGNVFVADKYNHRIQKWAPGATTGVKVAGFFNQPPDIIPVGIFGDNAGNLYVVSENRHEVVKFAPGSDTGVIAAGGNIWGNQDQVFRYPKDVFVDNSGNIYVADTEKNRIHKWAPGATAGVTVAGGNGEGDGPGQLYHPYSVCVDGAGNIYVSDVSRGITKWQPGASTGQRIAGGFGHICLDAAGNLIVSETWNNRVLKWGM